MPRFATHGAASEIKSTLSDVHTMYRGHVGIVTCMLDQCCVHSGGSVSVIAPMTVGFFREGSPWKIGLVSAEPLPD